MSTTDYGVCYDISSSPFVVEVDGIVYRFTSEKHMRKFEDDLEKIEDWVNDSLSRRFHTTIRCPALGQLWLYRKVERNGFCLEVEGEQIKCPEGLLFVGCPPKSIGSERP